MATLAFMREDVLLLLRVWRNGAESSTWRASLEDLRTKEFVRFSSIETLVRFIEAQEWNPRVGLKEPQHK